MTLPDRRVALALLAHPDDAEFLCAGKLVRLADAGWQVHIATATPGDCGTTSLPAEKIARIRRGQGAAAARLIGTEYHCLVGHTGVGKTELSKAIAELIFEDEKAMIRFDMYEHSGEHQQARLISAPGLRRI